MDRFRLSLSALVAAIVLLALPAKAADTIVIGVEEITVLPTAIWAVSSRI
jgi:hypothetical protein